MTKDKVRFTSSQNIDGYEYGKVANYFPTKFYLVYVLNLTLVNILIAIIIYMLSHNLIDTYGTLGILEIAIIVIFKIKLRVITEKYYNYKIKKGKIDATLDLEFYDDYFIQTSDTSPIKIEYTKLSKCIETDTCFYLVYNKDMIIILKKNECEIELIEFLRKKIPNLENRLGEKIKFKSKNN